MNSESLPQAIILASSSKYRRMLLQRLGLPFDCQSPDIDESPRSGETPLELVNRLALQKAQAVATNHPAAVIIGSDQVAVFDGKPLGKPGGKRAAFEQLMSFSAQTVEFLTAVTVISGHDGVRQQHVDHTQVRFRRLETGEVDRYLDKEEPYDCAGAFKAESLGIALFEKIDSEDPTALIGLPLIQTAAMLRKAGQLLP